jgi:hypothetical protein
MLKSRVKVVLGEKGGRIKNRVCFEQSRQVGTRILHGFSIDTEEKETQFEREEL